MVRWILVLAVITACGRPARDVDPPAKGSAGTLPNPKVDAIVKDAPSAGAEVEPPAAPTGECTKAGWCRVAELIPGDAMSAMYSDAPDRFWAVGERGLVLRWDGKQLAHDRLDETRHLEHVWSDGVTTWVIAKQGAIFNDRVFRHRDGKWTTFAVPPESSFDGVHGAAGHVWILGSHPPALLHVAPDGATDTIKTPMLVRAVWSASPTDVWVVGGMRVLRWTSGAWKELPPLPEHKNDGDGDSIDGTDERNVWVVSGRNTFVWDGIAWRTQTLKHQPYRGTIRVLGPRQAFFSDDSGFARFVDDHWTAYEATKGGAVALGADKLAISGIGFELRDGNTISRVPVGSGIDARDLWNDATGAWIGGRALDADRAAVAHWDGHVWHRETLAGAPIQDLDGVDAPWMLGLDGKVWRRGGGSWQAEDSGIRRARQLAVGGDAEAWVAGGGEVAHRVGTRWVHVPLDTMLPIEALATGPDGSVFLAQETMSEVALLRWDGGTFVRVATAVGHCHQLVVHGNDQVDVLGDGYRVSRWAGGEAMTNFSSAQLGDAVRLGDGVYYGGVFGPTTIDDPAWHEVDVPVGNAAISGGEGHVWAMLRNSGDLWVKAIPGARREPRVARRAPAGVIEVTHTSGNVARLQFTPPTGWTRTGGSAIAFAPSGGSPTLDISVGFDIADPANPAPALSAAVARIGVRTPDSSGYSYSGSSTEHGYLVVTKVARQGRTVRDVTCIVMKPLGTFAVQVHAVVFEEADANAIIAGCKSATML